jgi:hypothetical protein
MPLALTMGNEGIAYFNRVKIEDNSMIQIIEGQIGEVEKTEDLTKTAENRVSMAFES